jgi:uncharacterized membrane protein YfcA
VQIYLPIAEMPVSLLLILALGAAVGFISGMFGVGGGFLMTPLLIFLGVPPAVAVATQSAQITASATIGVLSAARHRALDLQLGAVLLAGGLVGTVLGVFFFAMRRLGQLDLVIALGYVTLFMIVGVLMLMDSVRTFTRRQRIERGKTVRPQRLWFANLPWRRSFPASGIETSLVPLVGLALFIGFAGAVLGIGGGFILVPVLMSLFRVQPVAAVSASQLQILCTMAVATVLHAMSTQTVDVVLAFLLIIGGVFGAQFGTRAGRHLANDAFRLLLALLVLGVGIRFAVELTATPRELFSIGGSGV